MDFYFNYGHYAVLQCYCSIKSLKLPTPPPPADHTVIYVRSLHTSHVAHQTGGLYPGFRSMNLEVFLHPLS